jgi:hypothetical protein
MVHNFSERNSIVMDYVYQKDQVHHHGERQTVYSYISGKKVVYEIIYDGNRNAWIVPLRTAWELSPSHCQLLGGPDLNSLIDAYKHGECETAEKYDELNLKLGYIAGLFLYYTPV